MSILKARNRKPIINFGLGVTEATINSGEEIIVNQTTIYLNDYNIQLETDLSFTKINNNKFILNGNLIGIHSVRVLLNGQINGNKIILNVPI